MMKRKLLSFHSIRIRLLLVIVAVAVLTGAIAASFAGVAITNQFTGYLAQSNQYLDLRRSIVGDLVDQWFAPYYDAESGWLVDLDDYVADVSQMIRYAMFVADANGAIVASTYENPETLLSDAISTPIEIDGSVVATVYVYIPSSYYSSNEDAFRESIFQSLVIAVLLAGIGSVLIVLALMHPTLKMVEELTIAARHIAKNKLDQRVSIRSRDEIGQLAQAFNEMADNLATTERLRKNMVTDIAHELRTPLSNLHGYMEALRDNRIPPSPELIHALYDQSTILSRLVDDLQDLVLADAGQLHMDQVAISLSAVAERALQYVRSMAQEANVVLRKDLPAEDIQIYADPDRVHQILVNLLQNAISYTPVGGHVTIKAEAQDNTVSIHVQDTGVGIEPEHLPFIFERFYRADSSRTRATGGSGIGLAIVKQLAQAHGGDIRVKSQPGRGSTFILHLPQAI